MAKKEAIQKKLVEDANIALADQLDLVSQINDKMSFLVKSQKDKFTQDKNSLDLTKEAYAITKRLNSEYEDSKAIQRDVARNKKLQNDVTRQQLNIEKEIGDEGKKRLQFIENQAKGLENSKKKLAELREKELAGVANAKQQAEALSQQIMSRQKSLETQKANLSYEEQQYGLLKQTQQALANNNALLDKELERVKNLEKQSKGVVTAMANLGKVLDKIGASGVAKVFTDTAEKSKKLIYEASAGGTKSVGAFTKMRIAAMSFGAALKVALGPMALIGMLISGFQKFKQRAEEAKNLMAEMSQQTMDFGRNLGMSSSMANKVAGSAKAIGGAMGMTRDQAVSSAEAIYGQIGGVEKLSDKTMKTFMKLNVHGGISAETIGRMYTMSKLTGASASLVAKNIANQAQESIKALKVNVNMKQVMEGVTKVSNRMLLASGGYSKSITTAVVQAKKLGLEMDQIENIANSLLNIEDSIAAEMEAELLTGKQLNLEKAREAALNNDIKGVMEEISKQGIDQESFTKMNRIQQDALAKSIGMSREGLADMLVTQKENTAENTDLIDTQKQGLAAMQSMASVSEQLAAREEARANQFAKIFALINPIVEAFKDLGPLVLEFITPIVEQLVPVVTKLAQNLFPAIQRLITSLAPVVTKLLEALMPVFDIIVELAIKLLPVIQQLFDAIIPIVVSILDAIMPILDVVIELAKVLLPVIVELFKSLMPILLPIFKIFEGIATYYAGIISGDISKVGEGLKKIGEGLLNLIMGVFQGLINIAIGVFEGIVQSIPGFGDTTFERVEFEPVKLATGGIVESPTRALIGEAGPEAVVPLNSDKSMNVFSKSLEEKLDRLIAAVEKGGVVMLDGQKVGEALVVNSYRVQ